MVWLIGIRVMSLIKLEKHSKEISCLRFNDPENDNALSIQLVEEFKRAIQSVNADRDIKVLILGGSKKVFCSGADREMLFAIANGEIPPVEIKLPKLILDLPIPVIAAMEGHAIGGGFSLGLCADIIILSHSSRYGFNFMNMGFTPGLGATRLAQEVFMKPLANELLFTGRCKKGKEFLGKSGFNAIKNTTEVMSTALEIAEEIAEKPRKAVCLLKRYLSLNKRRIFEETFTIETMMHEITFSETNIFESLNDGFNK